MKVLGLSAVIAGAMVTPAVACDLCSVYAASEAQGGTGAGFLGGIAESYNHFGTLRDGGHVIDIPGDKEFINSSVSQVFLGYNFNEDFGLQLNVPIIHRSWGSSISNGSETGLGDVSLIGNYVAYKKIEENYTFNWTVMGGIKFPTGDPNHLGDPDFGAGIGGHDLALGSGSYDGIVGTGVFGRWKRGFLTANVQYAIRSEGSFHHQYANDLTWSGGPGAYLLLKDDYTVALQGLVSGETKGKDTFSGVDDSDSAETLVYVGPQVNFTWKGKLSAQFGVDLPVSIYNSGTQVMSDYRVRAAVTWRF
jgi:hypothetical protein